MKLSAAEQKEILSNTPFTFTDCCSSVGHPKLNAIEISTIQINIGKWCNQACTHCHVDASPRRTESMNHETAKQCIKILSKYPEIKTVDLTGGAPEGHAEFKYIVTESHKLGKNIIVRCNLTILEEKGYENMHIFFKENNVQLVSSLPYFEAEATDKQRGNGVFSKSISALKKLNSIGYGIEKKLTLHLVHNPDGIQLSEVQSTLEPKFKDILKTKYQIDFTGLYALNNLPVSRLLESNMMNHTLDEHLKILTGSFNPDTIPELMCRKQLSISWDGKIFDCDFNQMLELPSTGAPTIFDFDMTSLLSRDMKTMAHCYGCTAGAGSSCSGQL
jgi:radical SAM/Cys-rich protein